MNGTELELNQQDIDTPMTKVSRSLAAAINAQGTPVNWEPKFETPLVNAAATDREGQLVWDNMNTVERNSLLPSTNQVRSIQHCMLTLTVLPFKSWKIIISYMCLCDTYI